MPPIILTAHQTARLEKAVLAVADTALNGTPYFAVGCTVEQAFGRLTVQLDVEGRGFWISLDQCVEVTRLVETGIDALAELQAHAYCLEVGSPGLFRQLTTARELQFYTGRRVHFTPLDAPVIGQKPPLIAETTWQHPETIGVLKAVIVQPEALGVEIEWEQAKTTATVWLAADIPNGWGLFLAPQVEWPEDDDLTALEQETADASESSDTLPETTTPPTVKQWRSL